MHPPPNRSLHHPPAPPSSPMNSAKQRASNYSLCHAWRGAVAMHKVGGRVCMHDSERPIPPQSICTQYIKHVCGKRRETVEAWHTSCNRTFSPPTPCARSSMICKAFKSQCPQHCAAKMENVEPRSTHIEPRLHTNEILKGPGRIVVFIPR